MKKVFLFIVVIVMVFLCGCTDKGATTVKTASKQSGTAAEEKEDNVKEIIPEGNTSSIINPQKGGFDELAATKRDSIASTKDNLTIKGTTYYVSMSGDDDNDGKSKKHPWKTFDAIIANSYMFESGDGILFERGGVYRMSSTYQVRSGLTFGAYGEGSKPAIYGSQKNYAQVGLWEPSRKKKVWKMSLNTLDAGIVVFNHGEAVGVKKFGLLDVNQNGDFYHNSEDNIIYLYVDKGYPDQVYKSIEIGTKGNMFHIESNAHDVVFDNLCIKYGGSHGIGSQGPAINVTISNCEVGWIGGSVQDANSDDEMRYGNGIQFWASCENCKVTNNWVYQCYDTGITFQGGNSDQIEPGNHYNDVSFDNNLIEYCNYAIELWDRTNTTTFNNVNVSDNIMRFTGYGWGAQRPDSYLTAHMFISNLNYDGMKNFKVCNNYFDCSNLRVMYWGSLTSDGTKIYKDLTFNNNSYYQKKASSDSAVIYGRPQPKEIKCSTQKEFENAIGLFDMAPKSVVWVN